MSAHEGTAVWGDEVVRNLREATAELKDANDVHARKISAPLTWVRCFCDECDNGGWLVNRSEGFTSAYFCPDCGRESSYFRREGK